MLLVWSNNCIIKKIQFKYVDLLSPHWFRSLSYSQRLDLAKDWLMVAFERYVLFNLFYSKLFFNQGGNMTENNQKNKPRCLIIDDDVDLLSLLHLGLSSHCHVDIAQNPFLAYSILTEHKYDLLLCDVHLPRINGIQFVRSLRDQGIFAKVILISADISLTLSEEAMKLGVIDFLTKPVSLAKLQNIMQQYVQCENLTQSNENYQEAGYVYNLFKSYYFDLDKLFVWMNRTGKTLHFIRRELERKQLTGYCLFDNPSSLNKKFKRERNNDRKPINRSNS